MDFIDNYSKKKKVCLSISMQGFWFMAKSERYKNSSENVVDTLDLNLSHLLWFGCTEYLFELVQTQATLHQEILVQSIDVIWFILLSNIVW